MPPRSPRSRRCEHVGGDKETSGREFASDVAFYQAVGDLIHASPRPLCPGGRSTALGHCQGSGHHDGKVTEVPWTTFNAEEAPLLLAELLGCPVQVAGSGTSTACHSNQHGKSPKRVPKIMQGAGHAPEGRAGAKCRRRTSRASRLHRHKKKSGIERGIPMRSTASVRDRTLDEKGAASPGCPACRRIGQLDSADDARGLRRLNKGQQAVV